MRLRTLFHDALARMGQTLAPAHFSRIMWLEVLVITLTGIALGMFFQHDNPFQIGGDFPWIWMAPVLVALRYGVTPGIVSSLILIAAWKLIGYLGNTHEDFPEQFFLGGLILTMLCGEFSAAWNARLRHAEESNRYLDERLSRITTRHMLLRLSHDRMEQELLTKPVTLRDALGSLRQLTLTQGSEGMPSADRLLQLLTQYCQLESAAILMPGKDGRYEPVSAIGTPPALRADDPLLRYAFEHKALAHLMVEGLDDDILPSPFLVIAPIMNSEQRTLGVLAIDRMPFLALNEENLQMLSVMLGYYADSVTEVEDVRRFRAIFPEATLDFAAEFHRLLQLQRHFHINSQIVVLPFTDDEAGRKAIEQLSRVRRGLDISWQQRAGNRMLLINLMPLASEAALEGYLLRIEGLLKDNFGTGYETWRLAPVHISLDVEDPVASLRYAVEGRV